ncbi:cytochrome c oxidase subunit 2A [Oceanobacillus luteolus]|uniref:Cytochrome c oxidase subunit 2A n=1 Tax=Oceanobacillus luteolus TaxID=1274358 RepID=A0ABW4HTD8_9BACI|nr:cytochrome c oxidase subunit 2A [Oceanobacillus luteolus]MCM3738905.1 cytochrome c oxidase subunit 2A [Oceanobacillus luteolus]
MVTKNQKHVNTNPESEPNLKGTLISVSILGAILLVTWIGALMLFLLR